MLELILNILFNGEKMKKQLLSLILVNILSIDSFIQCSELFLKETQEKEKKAKENTNERVFEIINIISSLDPGSEGHLNTVRALQNEAIDLIKKSHNINEISYLHGSNGLLHLAAAKSLPVVLEHLLENKADVNALNSSSQTALDIIATKKIIGALDLMNIDTLMKYNANINSQNNFNRNTPLHAALLALQVELKKDPLKKQRLRVIEIMLNYRPDLNIQNRFGITSAKLIEDIEKMIMANKGSEAI